MHVGADANASEVAIVTAVAIVSLYAIVSEGVCLSRYLLGCTSMLVAFAFFALSIALGLC